MYRPVNPDWTPTLTYPVPARPVSPAVGTYPTLTGPRLAWTRSDPRPSRRDRRRARRAARPWWRKWYTWTAVTVVGFALIGILAPPQPLKGPDTIKPSGLGVISTAAQT